MKYRLGLDIGTNSIGFAILNLGQDGIARSIERVGVRIFTDGRNQKDQTTLSAHRRMKRLERRRRDRFIMRKKKLLAMLVECHLFPTDPIEQQNLKQLDVLSLRAEAVHRRLKPFELGRVLYHLNRKRGFLSNRKGGSDEDRKNKITDRIKNLQNELEKQKCVTVGQFLYSRCQQGLSTKATIETGFHIVRGLIESEFDAIVEFQRKYHPGISLGQWHGVRSCIFHQRPLKQVETGACAIYSDRNRAFRFMPSFQEFRFLSELHNLKYQDENFITMGLNEEQIYRAFDEFRLRKDLSYKKLKKFLNLESVIFSIEKSKTKEKMKISETNDFFVGLEIPGLNWAEMPLSLRDQICEIFFSDKEAKEITCELENILPSEVISAFPMDTLPTINEATASFSKEALQKIVDLSLNERRHPALVAQDLMANERHENILQDNLSYYGYAIPESTQTIPRHILENGSVVDKDERMVGRIANPTVHAALRQLEKVVNEIVGIYGRPDAIHIELARDLKRSREEKNEAVLRNKKNEDLNGEVLAFIKKHKQKATAFNFERVKLWFELTALKNQVCVYSGQTISARMVLSEEVEIDHILPFRRTLDDGFNNKVLVVTKENRLKKNRTPFEAFGGHAEKWAEVQERAKLLPFAKQWRFAPDAMKKFGDENGFLERHLNDTRYISKVAAKYLGTIVPDKSIVSSKGMLTSLLRAKLGLNKLIQSADGKKDRMDHRHHGIDALVVALTSRSFLKQVSDMTGKGGDPNRVKVPEPWDGFFAEAKKSYDNIVVSHKLDHGRNGPLLEETCFGLISNPNEFEIANKFHLVRTLARADIKDMLTIRDSDLRKIALKKGIDALPKEIKKVRCYEKTNESVEDLGSLSSGVALVAHGAQKQHLKFYQKGDINFLGIWLLPKKRELTTEGKGHQKDEYVFWPVKTFDLNSGDANSNRPHPAAKLVAKIFKGDTVLLEVKGQKSIYVVKSIRAANKQLYFLEHNRSKEKDGEKKFLLSFSKLSSHGFRKVFIKPSGMVVDRGPLLK